MKIRLYCSLQHQKLFMVKRIFKIPGVKHGKTRFQSMSSKTKEIIKTAIALLDS